MYAGHYDPKLIEETIYQDVFFTIEGDQFPEDAELSDVGRIHELDDAKQAAQVLADRFGQAVEVSVYGTWGMYGREYVESFKIHPMPFFGDIRADLAALWI